jgi:hypothetical protein
VVQSWRNWKAWIQILYLPLMTCGNLEQLARLSLLICKMASQNSPHRPVGRIKQENLYGGLNVLHSVSHSFAASRNYCRHRRSSCHWPVLFCHCLALFHSLTMTTHSGISILLQGILVLSPFHSWETWGRQKWVPCLRFCRFLTKLFILK